MHVILIILQKSRSFKEQQLEATAFEVTSIQAATNPNDDNFLGFRQVQFVITIWYSGFQIMSMLFVPSIPWTNESKFAAQAISLRFFSLPNVSMTIVWHIVLLSLYWIAYTTTFIFLYIISHSSTFASKLSETLTKVKPVLFETFLIPSIVTLTAVLKCSSIKENDTTLYLAKIEDWQCYTPSHIVSLVIILPLTCMISYYVYKYETSKDQFDDIFILMISFKVLDITFEIFSAGIISFYEEYAVVIILFTVFYAIGMESMIVYFQPCLGSGRYLNVHFACIYALIIWTGICSISATIPSTPITGLAEILLIVGFIPVMYGARKLCLFYANKRDEELFDQCKIFMDPLNSDSIKQKTILSSNLNQKTETNINPDIENNPDQSNKISMQTKRETRLAAAKEALILSLVSEYHARLLDIILQNNGQVLIQKVLNNPKCDESYKIIILKILTNIANMNNQLRSNIIHTDGLISTLIKINKSTTNSTVTITYPRAALGVLCNISVHPDIYNVVTKKLLLEIVHNMESGVDYSLRMFAAQIILNLISSHKKTTQKKAKLKKRTNSILLPQNKQTAKDNQNNKEKQSFSVVRSVIKKDERKSITCSSRDQIKTWLLEDHLFKKIWWLVSKSDDTNLVLIGLSLINCLSDSISRCNTLQNNSKWFDVSFIEKLRDDCIKGIKTFENKKKQNMNMIICQKCEIIMKHVAKSSGFRKSELTKSKSKLLTADDDHNNEKNILSPNLNKKIKSARLKLQVVSNKIANKTNAVQNNGAMVVNLDE